MGYSALPQGCPLAVILRVKVPFVGFAAVYCTEKVPVWNPWTGETGFSNEVTPQYQSSCPCTVKRSVAVPPTGIVDGVRETFEIVGVEEHVVESMWMATLAMLVPPGLVTAIVTESSSAALERS